MKKNVFIFFLFPSLIFAQVQYGYFNNLLRGNKYFISLGYGTGTAKWNSIFESTEFYDKDGKVINTGDFRFRAKSSSRHYEISVFAPVKKIRLGMGIFFEEHYLSTLQIYTEPGQPFILFDEYLRFDKICFLGEVPFRYEFPKKYSFNLDFHAGWYGYTDVKRIHFIGERPFPVSFLFGIGITADYEIFKKVFVFTHPNFEYKFYDNSRTESPVQIRHHVFSGNIIGGLRFNLAK